MNSLSSSIDGRRWLHETDTHVTLALLACRPSRRTDHRSLSTAVRAFPAAIGCAHARGHFFSRSRTQAKHRGVGGGRVKRFCFAIAPPSVTLLHHSRRLLFRSRRVLHRSRRVLPRYCSAVGGYCIAVGGYCPTVGYYPAV